MKLKNIIIISSFLTTICVGTLGISGCSGGFFSGNDQTETTLATTHKKNDSKADSNKDITYTIQYYIDDKADKPSDKTTTVKYGEKTPVLTIKELGFTKEGKKFAGWKVYREADDTWSLRTIKDKKQSWKTVVDGKLPDGYEYKLHGDGSPSVMATKSGSIKLYATWVDK